MHAFEQIENHFSIAVGFLGLLVVLMLLRYRKSNALINIYLIIIIFFSSIRLIDQGVFNLYALSSFFVSYQWTKPILLVAIPTFYLYFKTIFNETNSFKKNHFYHFIYPTLNIVFYNLQHSYFINNVYAFKAQKLGVILFLMYYLVITLKLVYAKLYKETNQGDTSNNQLTLRKKWSLFFMSIAILLCIGLIVPLLFEVWTGIAFKDNSNALPKSLLWFGIFVKIISSAEILHGYPRLKRSVFLSSNPTKLSVAIWNLDEPTIRNLQDAKLKDTIRVVKEEYIINLTTFVNTNFPFRQNDYDLDNLAEDLKIPKSHLTYIFKYYCNLSFVNYKNIVE